MIDLTNIPNKRPRGQTRGQTRLVPCQPPNDCDLRSAFVLVLAAFYCENLELVTGTLACSAVLGFLSNVNVLNRVLGNVKNKFERLQNRKQLKQSVSVIHEWIHKGDKERTSRLIRLYKGMGGALSTDEEQVLCFCCCWG